MLYRNYFLVILAVSAVSAGISLILLDRILDRSSIRNIAATETEISDMSYEIRDKNGLLQVRCGDGLSVYTIPEFQVSFLNEYDRNLAVNGISAGSEKELRRLIEDLTG